MQSQRQLGGSAYPLLLGRLAELSGDSIAEVMKGVQAAEKQGLLAVTVTLAGKSGQGKLPHALVALHEDAALLAPSELLLVSALREALSGADSVELKELGKALKPAVRTAFQRSLQQRLTERDLPDGFGALRLAKGGHLLFRLSSIIGLPAVPAAAPVPHGPEPERSAAFEPRFLSAFQRLDRASGERNYVLLHDLRHALSDMPREEFDRGLRELRRSRRFTLDASDGRHDRLSPEALAAGIWESGNLLVYVARREPS